MLAESKTARRLASGGNMQKVVVIGAGLAGAAAALRLADAGQSVTLVEARGRLGGRTYSRAFGDLTDLWEFGGGWICERHLRMKALTNRFGMGLRPRLSVTERRWHDGAVLRTDAPVAADRLEVHLQGLAVVQADSMAMQGGAGRWEGGNPWAGMSFADYMQARGLPETVRREFIAWWTLSGSADITKVNVLDALQCASYCGGTMEATLEELTHTIEGGVGTLTARMIAASGARVILGDAVVAVADRGDHAALRLSSGQELRAGQLVVAVPVNALDTIRFDPPLRPSQTQLSKEGHQGRAVKVLMRVRGVQPGVLVTGEAGGLRLMLSERALSDGTTAVIGFGLADEVADTSGAAIDRALRQFFPEATLLDNDWHDWVRDPWSAGTWVSHGLGQSALFAAAEWAQLGRLHFAGSDIAATGSGWFEGAVASGEAAADAILALAES
jgi:monoamine oxidase